MSLFLTVVLLELRSRVDHLTCTKTLYNAFSDNVNGKLIYFIYILDHQNVCDNFTNLT